MVSFLGFYRLPSVRTRFLKCAAYLNYLRPLFVFINSTSFDEDYNLFYLLTLHLMTVQSANYIKSFYRIISEL
jgi:hypothetical protein